MMGLPAKMDSSLWRVLVMIVKPQQKLWVLLIKMLDTFVLIMRIGMVDGQKAVLNPTEMGDFISIDDLVENSREMTRFFA